jgi:acetolactate decarboxylase
MAHLRQGRRQSLQARPDNRTPLATDVAFDRRTSPGPFIEALEGVDEKAANPNVFCAVRVEGSFSYMKTHALQMQSKPYPPTAEVVRACVQFEMKDGSGTIVGFRGPPYVKGVNDTGYHLHFLSDDKTRGGHIREFVMDRGTCAISICGNHLVIMPEDGAALAGIDMSRDLVDEFHAALSHAE